MLVCRGISFTDNKGSNSAFVQRGGGGKVRAVGGGGERERK